MAGVFPSLVCRWVAAVLIAVSLSIAGGTFTHMDAFAGDRAAHTHVEGTDTVADHDHHNAGIDVSDGNAALHCGAPILATTGGINLVHPAKTVSHNPSLEWMSVPHLAAVDPPPPRPFRNIT